jgi:NAD(P)-dependent dehydrogenase (short-subunit alcohol dehydrogenase family)
MTLAIVTGATSGIGLETAVGLARAGHDVVIGARDAARGAAAASTVRGLVPNASVEVGALDLANLASVRAFAGNFTATGRTVDILVNNAGIMGLPERRLTADGFELQFGTNHLGHFALTAQMMPALMRATAPRVVTVASLAHRRASLDLDDLNAERSYVPNAIYARTKLANLIFALEFARRAAAAGSPLKSIAAHPGWSQTGIIRSMAPPGSLKMRAVGLLMALTAQPAARGAMPTLYAATSPDAVSGGYYGPNGMGEMRGKIVKPASISPAARDGAMAARLWTLSEQMTGTSFSPL